MYAYASMCVSRCTYTYLNIYIHTEIYAHMLYTADLHSTHEPRTMRQIKPTHQKKRPLHLGKKEQELTKETPTSGQKRPNNLQKRPLDLDKRDLHALQGNSNVRNIGDHRAKKPPQQLF